MFLDYLKLSNHLYKNIEIDVKNIAECLLNSQKINFFEENILNYISKNTTQPIDMVFENPLIEGEHDQYNTPVISNAIGKGNDDCMTQYNGKPQDENAENVKKFPCEEVGNLLAIF